MIKQALILLILSFAHTLILAQSPTGILTDTKYLPIAGAQVLNLRTGDHTHSSESGEFILQKISIGDTLLLSHISYETNKTIVQSLSLPIRVSMKENSIFLEEVVISPKTNALNVISDIDIKTNPVNSSQDILRQVPGLFIGQHAGGGKAEQIFLRGFDIDHGTDINISVDGLPVNMISHAHGQGYADLHFVIPETVDKIDFGKGPYYAQQGNFNTAAYVDFKTKSALENNSIKLERGQFNTSRLLNMFKLIETDHQDAYVSTEYLSTDGTFESPQNFSRLNLFGKYTAKVRNTDKVGISLSHFTSKWDASGQIPQRAVDNGLLTRFGAIDDTEGGQTSRTNILLNYDKFLSDQSFIKNRVFFTKYDFLLYSNFTFFLEDPANGDQIRQKESRNIFGLNSAYTRTFSTAQLEGSWEVGISLRNDQSIDNELSHTRNRSETLNYIRLGNINETNFATYFNTSVYLGKWTINPSIRLDYFDFQYNDALTVQYDTQSSTKAIINPKLNVLYDHSLNLQLYAKGGKGFHSNDTRVVVAQNGKEILPSAYGFDIGALWKPAPRVLVNAAYWYLFLEQEFVYVGDAGIVEPSGQTLRKGVEVSIRTQLFDWLFWNFDANYAHARAKDGEAGNVFIPLAPDFTLTTGLNIIHKSGFYGGTTVRHIKDRPANEDNSIVAEGYTIVDLNAGYKWKKVDFGIQIQNLLDTEWNETQFATTSRLIDEPNPTEEIHFTPGAPFFVKTSIEYRF